jgi:hypothetical protein
MNAPAAAVPVSKQGISMAKNRFSSHADGR